MRIARILELSAFVLSTIVIAWPVRGRTAESLKDVPINVTSITTEQLAANLSVVDSRLFDRFSLTTGKKFVSGSTANVITRGWNCQPGGKSWNCDGPAVDRVYVNFVLVDGIRLSDKVGLELGYAGQSTSSLELDPFDLERIEVVRGPQGVLFAPPQVRAGDVFVISPKIPIDDGKWQLHVGERSFDALDPSTLGAGFDIGGPLIRDRVFFQMPGDATDLDDLRLTYDGPFGNRWIDAPAPDYVWGGSAEPCEAQIDACQERAVVDGTLCVCGCFPELSWWGLTLDGKPIPAPLTASSRTVRFPLPEGIAPGTHTVEFPAAGQSIEFEAVQVQGSIDRNKLKSGQSANLKFWLVGTETPLPMGIQLTQGNVSIVGGNVQVAHTIGGADNHFKRVLWADAPGAFSLDYTFAAAPCPCPAESGTQLIDDSLAVHPAAAAGGIKLDFPSKVKALDILELDLKTDSLVITTDLPPFEAGQDLEIDFLQLGLRGITADYGEFVFEQQADQRSFGRFSDIGLNEEGGFGSGAVDLELHADFTTAFSKKLPLKIGASYDIGLSDFTLGGTFEGIGEWTFSERPGSPSTLRLENIRKDAAGTMLRGDATFRLYGLADMKLNF